MTLRRAMREFTNSLLGPLGLEIVRKQAPPSNSFTMEMGLSRAQALGLGFQSIIDIGASDGKWTLMAMRFFPNCHYLLFEPLEERRAALDQLKSQHPQLGYVSAAAGDKPGQAIFSVTPDLDGSGISDNPNKAARPVAVTPIDLEIQRRKIPPPYFLKFDTHGYELQILEGARETLQQTRLIVMEVYNFQLGRRCLRLHEMCAHLESLGFRCYDLADPMLRPKDSALWQMDLFFIPKTCDLFQYAGYQ